MTGVDGVRWDGDAALRRLCLRTPIHGPLHDARIPTRRPASLSPGSEDRAYFDMSLV